jgi:hypothetical protein
MCTRSLHNDSERRQVKHLQVDSSTIVSMGWEEGMLEVVFKNGMYVYRGVPEQLWEDLVKASSKGAFLAKWIKGKFPVERL